MSNHRLIMPWSGWAWRLAILPPIYLSLYVLFGYYIAWQSPALREFYSGSTAILPFFQQWVSVTQETPLLLPLQLIRGLIWIGLALPIIKMMRGNAWETSLAVGLLFGLLLTVQLAIPSPFMPAPVRLAHFVETSTSTFIFGALIGWLFTRRG